MPNTVAGMAMHALVAVALSPETRRRPEPLPRYRPQRPSVPAEAQGQYVAVLIGALLAFAVFGLFTGLAGTVLHATLHRTAPALAGATIFLAFGAGILMQTASTPWPIRPTLVAGVALMLGGLAVVVTAVWLPAPSPALFLCGGAVAGAGEGPSSRARWASSSRSRLRMPALRRWRGSSSPAMLESRCR